MRHICRQSGETSLSKTAVFACISLLLRLFAVCAAKTDHVTEHHAYPRRVLVMGGNGFLGASSVQRLTDRGHNVTVVNRGNWYWDSAERVQLRVQEAVSCDRQNGVHSCQDLVSLVDAVGRFDAVVDFSAYSRRDTVDMTSLLRHKADLYIHISTDSVYDVCDPEKRAPGPVREQDAVRPEDKGLRDLLSSHHDYGHRKLEAEEALLAQRYNHTDDQLGIPYVILRLPDVLGPRDTTYRFWLYQLWVRLASVLRERPVTIPSFLAELKNSFVYVDDVAKVVVDALEAGPDNEAYTDQVFNLAWPEQFTLEEFLRDVETALGISERQQFHSDDDHANMYLYPTVRCGPMDVSKALEQINWKPTPWTQAINSSVEFYESAMKESRWRTQRDEIIQIVVSQLYSDNAEHAYDTLEKIYEIDLGHFRPKRDEL